MSVEKTSISSSKASQQPSSCAAKNLMPDQRQAISLQALSGQVPVTQIAQAHHVSRKFVYQQQAGIQKVSFSKF